MKGYLGVLSLKTTISIKLLKFYILVAVLFLLILSFIFYNYDLYIENIYNDIVQLCKITIVFLTSSIKNTLEELFLRKYLNIFCLILICYISTIFISVLHSKIIRCILVKCTLKQL